MAKRKPADLQAWMEKQIPDVIQRLYELLNEEDTSAATKLSIVKEILDRTVGKGQITMNGEEARTEGTTEIVLRVEGE